MSAYVGKSFCVFVILFSLLCCHTQKKSSHLSKRKSRVLNALSVNRNADTIIVNPPYLTEPTSGSNKPNYITIKTFFATDRNIILKGSRPVFGIDRSEIHYGSCNVSIPLTHAIGSIEAPSTFRFESESPEKHVSILTIGVNTKDKFYSDLKKQISQTSRKDILIFVHGYNIKFKEAAQRTAQLCYDLQFKGIPMFYSWPSQESYFTYTRDEDNCEWSAPNFSNFLSEIISNNPSSRLYLVAHSMGNRILTSALKNFIDKKLNNSIQEIILAAPDIDSDVFKRDISPMLISVGKPVTLYVSSKDVALLASQIVNGYQRAGDARKRVIITKGIETIKVDNVSTNFFGHSYLGESRLVTEDIFNIVNNGLRADRRHLIKINKKNRNILGI